MAPPAPPSGVPAGGRWAPGLPPPARRGRGGSWAWFGGGLLVGGAAGLVLAWFVLPLLGPQSHGDDEHLDELWAACQDGDMRSCDLLYWESPVGSDYERYGRTCGRRVANEDGYYCYDLDPDSPAGSLGN